MKEPAKTNYNAAAVRMVAINNQIIVAPRVLTGEQIKRWFEDREEILAGEMRVVSLLDKHEGRTIADAVNELDLETARLPRFL